MSHAAQKSRKLIEVASNPITFALLSVYIFFFRLSRWKGNMRDTSAMSGVVATAMFLLMTMLLWVEIGTGYRFDTNKYLYALLVLAVAWFAVERLLVRKARTQFEDRFDEYTTRDRLIVRNHRARRPINGPDSTCVPADVSHRPKGKVVKTAAPTLETERLRLRAHTRADFGNCAAMWAEPEVVRYLGGKPNTREDCWMRMLRQPGLWAFTGMGNWLVETKAGEFIGEIGFLWLKRDMEPRIEGFPEVGWITNARAHGKGYASEAVAAALAWGDANLPHTRFTCIIHPDNAASLNVARKAGFTEYARGVYHNDPIVCLERVRG